MNDIKVRSPAPPPTEAPANPGTYQRGRRWLTAPLASMIGAALMSAVTACHRPISVQPKPKLTIEPFSFQVSSGADHYQIEGYLARTDEPGRMPALLVLNGNGGDAHQCINHVAKFAELKIRLACISLPGYGKSSGPSRFVGPQSVAAARRGLDLVASRPDVDATHLAIWGIADGAVAAGLVMDSDRRPRAIILQSGAYDLVKLWPRTTLGTKLSILRQVWPSRRVLQERSVIENLPKKLDCSVLILHGEQDRKNPLTQAQQLARALQQRGAHVETRFFPDGTHQLGEVVDQPLRDFLRANLSPAASQGS
jgi:pimeloyl-ACP methyl ester carboxylesterase